MNTLKLALALCEQQLEQHKAIQKHNPEAYIKQNLVKHLRWNPNGYKLLTFFAKHSILDN